jgi:hypothetical protein
MARRSRYQSLLGLVVATAAISCSMASAPAQASPTWLAAKTVSGPDFMATLGAKVVVDRFGNATAVWLRSASGVGLLEAAHRPAGGTWSEPQTVSDLDHYAQGADVVVDDKGTVTAVWWASAPGEHDQIESARRKLGGSWSSPTLVGLSDLGAPRVAVDHSGQVTAVWLQLRSGKYAVSTSTLAPGGYWSLAKTLSNLAYGSVSPAVAADRKSGMTVATWMSNDGVHSVIWASRRPSGGTWSTPQQVSESGQDANNNPQVTVDNLGNATIVFGRYDSGSHDTYVSSSTPTGAWSTPEPLSDPANFVTGQVVTTTAKGQTVAAWTEYRGGFFVVRASVRSQGGWSAAVSLSDEAYNAASIATGVAPDGSTYVMWHLVPTYTLQIVRRTASGGWSSTKDLGSDSLPSLDPVHSIGVDAGGNAVVAYEETSTQARRVRVRALDRAGPVVSSLTVPGSALPRSSARFSVKAKDTWSKIASYQWRFGDGTKAKGRTTSHAYARPGTYRVKLTIRDAVGNVTTRSKIVRVGR